ncbi:Starch-binding associating with outer membrane [Arenibacter palladensis]|uniref:Starch-binding associating with outer membrane n=1 Tax=Arenibacter palladensis TaxID=237373 RepID=A0A1M4W144_9FLAO|nr:RagB/SusD family nutrient uptake outer membrane protein [Arenibacter palladensis]SHE74968.1 Starch-binding associating with outer membrane [Arenibacter palladensis]
MKYIYSLTLAVIFLFCSCDKVLDKTPLDTISSNVFWLSENDFKLAANDLYGDIDLSTTTDVNSIDYYNGSTVSNGTLQPSNTDGNIWANAYTRIRRANDLIENAATSAVDEPVKNRYVAEARFFRAFYHALLVKRYGDVPYVDMTLEFSDVLLPKDSRETVVNKIISDLNFAADNLPKKSELNSADEGRITKGVALGYLSRVALYEGTWAKFHNSGGDANNLLTVARDAALQVINDGEYEVFQAPLEELFFNENQDNVEVMLSIRYDETQTGVSPRGRGHLIDALQDPTKYLVDSYLCTDGLPIDRSTLFQGYTSLESEFKNRDPRMKAAIWEPGTMFDGQPLVPDLTRTATGYWPKKPGDPLAQIVTFIYTDVILMRYAEVLLNYAEAVYELENAISDSDLDISINQLRSRTGVSMPSLTNAFAAANSLDMRGEIRRERRVELAGEGFRYDDIIRWKTAENDLPKAVLGALFQQSAYPELTPGTDVMINSDGFIQAEVESARSFETPKNYLFPLPLRELQLNPNLQQNPGW